jgi:hypothetical protein
LSLFPVAVARLEDGIVWRALAGAAAYAAVVVVAFAGPVRLELIAMATAVTGAGATMWLSQLTRRRIKGVPQALDN